MAPPWSVLSALEDLQRALSAEIADICATRGLTESQFAVLAVLSEHPGRWNAEIGRALGITPQSSLALLDALTARGLVERVQDAAHHKRLNNYVTIEGGDVARVLLHGVEELQSRMLHNLDTSEQARLGDYLRAAVDGRAHPGAATEWQAR